ncbi:MAG: hypothetical protein AB7G11_10060 [Phycisphaerales bacterium]
MPRTRRPSRPAPDVVLRGIADQTAIVLASPLSVESKRSIIRHWLWGVTERFGKFMGCPYWSVAATERLRASGAAGIPRWAVHEHVVPRRIVASMLIDLPDPTPDAVRDTFSRFALACVVMKEEAKAIDFALRDRMPAGFCDPASPEYQDPWSRYRAAGVSWRGPIEWRDGVPVSDAD